MYLCDIPANSPVHEAASEREWPLHCQIYLKINIFIGTISGALFKQQGLIAQPIIIFGRAGRQDSAGQELRLVAGN